jgi:hypothetical protein
MKLRPTVIEVVVSDMAAAVAPRARALRTTKPALTCGNADQTTVETRGTKP